MPRCNSQLSIARPRHMRHTLAGIFKTSVGTSQPPFDDGVAEKIGNAKKVEPSMGEVMTRVAFVDGESSAAAMPPQLQYRIRGALNAAGFESTGRKISSGDYKGVTAFARVQREQE